MDFEFVLDLSRVVNSNLHIHDALLPNNSSSDNRYYKRHNHRRVKHLEDFRMYVYRFLTVSSMHTLHGIKGSPEGSSDQEFRGSILCDVIEIS